MMVELDPMALLRECMEGGEVLVLSMVLKRYDFPNAAMLSRLEVRQRQEVAAKHELSPNHVISRLNVAC